MKKKVSLLFMIVFVCFSINSQKIKDIDTFNKKLEHFVNNRNAQVLTSNSFDNVKSTLHSLRTNVVFEEDFENATNYNLPPGWTEISAHPDDYWYGINTNEFYIGLPAYSGDRCAFIPFAENDAFMDLDAWLFSPEIELTGGNTYTISFWLIKAGFDVMDEYDYLEVYIGQGASAESMAVGYELYYNTTDNYIDWTLISTDYTPSESGNYNLGFHAFTPWYEGFFIVVDYVLVTSEIEEPEGPTGVYTGEVNAVISLLGIDETFDGITIELKESATTANYSLVIAEMDLGNGSLLPEYELDDVIVTPSGAGYSLSKSGSVTVIIPVIEVPPLPPFTDVPATVTLENGYIENNNLDLEIKAVASLGIFSVEANIYFNGTKEAPSVYYVSGIVSLPTGNTLEGVTISYLDTYTVTTANGYSIEVPAGTNLTITPSLEGYTFEPESITILDISENHYQQNFLAIEEPVYYVSGIVSLPTGNTLEGVTISYLDTFTITTANGYSIEVPAGTDLTITPSLEGYTFEPEYITILNISENHYQQSFLAIEDPVYYVSGIVSLATGNTLEGVTISYLDTYTVTTANGYSIEVPAGTDLTITPSLVGYTFEPESITILNISENHYQQNFLAIEEPVYYVSGIVSLATGNTLEGVIISYLDTYTVTTANGYSIEVPAGTDLTITPTLEGYTFEPESITILDISENHYQQNFLAIEGYSIYGTVSCGNSGAENQKHVQLFKFINNQMYNLIDEQIIEDGESSYSFSDIAPGIYIVKARNTNCGLPTYFGDVVEWKDAITITLLSDERDFNANINIIETPSIGIGNSVINGYVTRDDVEKSFSNNITENPVINEIVYLQLWQEENWETVEATITDNDGFYEFLDLPTGKYRLFLDIPGLEMLNFIDFDLNENHTISGIDFIITEDGIITVDNSSSIELISQNSRLQIYPNPTSGKFSVISEQLSENNVEIFDISGRKLSTFKLDKLSTQIDISLLTNGIYFVKIGKEIAKIVKK